MTVTVSTTATAPGRLRRTRAAGWSLAAGAATFALAAVLDPATPDGGLPEVMAYADAHAGAWTLWALLLVATGLLLLPGTAALSRLVPPGRGARLALVGVGATGAGLVGLAGLGVSETVLPVLAEGREAPEVVAAAERLEESAGLGVVFLLLFLGFYVGLPVLTWGLRRAGVVALWVPVAATVGSVASWFGSELANPWEALARVPVLAALVGLSVVLVCAGGDGAGEPAN